MNTARLMCVFGLILSLPFGGAVAADATASRVIRYTPGMKADALRGLPDSTLVTLSSGRQVSLGQVRQLRALGQRMRSTVRKPLPPALLARAAARGTRVANSDDLRAALSRPDSDTIELPSGRRMTVGQLKFVMPQVEQALGRPLGPGLAASTARVLPVDSRSDWKSILQMPDTTLLQTPKGTRVTVGDIKQALREETTARIGTSR
jgi:hypothetical protein